MEMKIKEAKVYERKRRFKYGGNAVILTISVVGLFVVAYMALARGHWRIDLTANRSFSLAPQTVQVIEGLEQPVMIRAFFRPGGDLDQIFIRRKVDDVLREYAAKSDQIDYAMIDPDVDLEQTLAFGIQSDGTIVFQSNNRRKDIYQSVLFNYPSLAESSVPLFVGESLFTNALLSIIQGEIKQLCFLSGHGERKVSSDEADGLRKIFDLIKNENYLVETVSLGENTEWDKRCDLLIIAGPRMGFHSVEDQALLRYLGAGKKMILMVDPQSASGLDATLAALGVSFHKGVVFDPERRFILGPHYPTPILGNHPITEKIKEEELKPAFYLARSILIKEGERGDYEAEAILSSSEVAWGETELKVQVKATPDPDVDLEGPLVLGAAITLKSKKADMETAEKVALIFGDSNFITNGLIEIPGNKDLILNGIAWLLGQEGQIAIRPQKPDFRPLIMETQQASLVAVSTQLVYPGLILGFGLVYWWRRKRA
jgi:ABC-type uncharacterized transport system involved in gliding motility auxiliary subunit